MKKDELLGQLSALHQMMVHLLGSLPEQECYRRFNPDIAPLAWLFGRAVYLESYWLGEANGEGSERSALVRDYFSSGVEVSENLIMALPDRDHLINWALELQDENLTRLANPTLLPNHPLVERGVVLPLIVQHRAQLCEQMLWQLTERQLTETSTLQVHNPLVATPPSTDHADLHKGHYRIGAREGDLLACDDELPTNSTELDAFRIDRAPVSNAAYLSFIEAGGYLQRDLWGEEGWQWLSTTPHQHPHLWRRDGAGNWYGIGLGGTYELNAGEPVSGISHHEASAYAAWVGTLGGSLGGAVVQHEYQWEVAARSGALSHRGRAWEWCANPFHLYSGYSPSDDPERRPSDEDPSRYSLRGGSLHSQRIQRRSSARHHAPATTRHMLNGTRLVFPASSMPWHK